MATSWPVDAPLKSLVLCVTQCFWFVPLEEVWRVDYNRTDYLPLGTVLLQLQRLNASIQADSGPLPPGIFQQGASLQ